MPLKKITVLDLSRLVPGGFCSLLLADLGARVVKIEEPGIGDFYRRLAKIPLLGAGFFEGFNRGKQSLPLNLKSAAGKKIFLQLVGQADVVIEGFRPGRLKKLGLDFARLKKANPKIILCSITGYGQDGPLAGRAGHDLNYLAEMGLLSLLTDQRGEPIVPGLQLADLVGGGLYGALTILAALYERDQSGRAAWIDLAMSEGVASLAGAHFVATQYGASDQTPTGGLLEGKAASYQLYQTADKGLLSVAALEPKFWQKLTAALGLEAGASGFGEPVYRLTLKQRLQKIVAQKSLRYWQRLGEELDICLHPVRALSELARSSHVKARDLLFEQTGVDGRRITYLKSPFRFNGQWRYTRRTAPRYGEHTRTLLRGLGYSATQIRQLRKEGVVE